MERFDLTFLSLFFKFPRYTHLTRKKTQHHGTVRTLLLPSFCVRFLLCAQPCLNNYKCIACTCTSTHSFVGLISSVISTTSRFSIFYFFFGVLFPSFSFLTPMRGKFILLARNRCTCTLQEEVNSILASCFFWIYVVIMKEK